MRLLCLDNTSKIVYAAIKDVQRGMSVTQNTKRLGVSFPSFPHTHAVRKQYWKAVSDRHKVSNGKGDVEIDTDTDKDTANNAESPRI